MLLENRIEKIMNVFHKIVSSVIAMSAIVTMAMLAFRAEDVEPDDAAPRALQVLIVSEDGNTLYTGEEAERVFQELNSIQSYVEPEMLTDTSMIAELTSNDGMAHLVIHTDLCPMIWMERRYMDRIASFPTYGVTQHLLSKQQRLPL